MKVRFFASTHCQPAEAQKDGITTQVIAWSTNKGRLSTIRRFLSAAYGSLSAKERVSYESEILRINPQPTRAEAQKDGITTQGIAWSTNRGRTKTSS